VRSRRRERSYRERSRKRSSEAAIGGDDTWKKNGASAPFLFVCTTVGRPSSCPRPLTSWNGTWKHIHQQVTAEQVTFSRQDTDRSLCAQADEGPSRRPRTLRDSAHVVRADLSCPVASFALTIERVFVARFSLLSLRRRAVSVSRIALTQHEDEVRIWAE
jgi:hypothetical protein